MRTIANFRKIRNIDFYEKLEKIQMRSVANFFNLKIWIFRWIGENCNLAMMQARPIANFRKQCKRAPLPVLRQICKFASLKEFKICCFAKNLAGMQARSTDKTLKKENALNCQNSKIPLILQPISVLLTDGCGLQLLLNILLTCLFFLPGIIHAFFLILRQKWIHFEFSFSIL